MSSRWTQLLFVVGAVAVAPACSSGESSNSKVASQPQVISRAGSSEQALRAEVNTLLKRDASALVQFTLPSGAKALHFGEHFHSAAVVRRNADGSLTTECFDEAHAATEFLASERTLTGEVQ